MIKISHNNVGCIVRGRLLSLNHTVNCVGSSFGVNANKGAEQILETPSSNRREEEGEENDFTTRNTLRDRHITSVSLSRENM